MARPRIQVLLDETEMPANVRGALATIEAEVELAQFAAGPSESTARSFTPNSIDARLLVTADAAKIANGNLDRLLKWCDQDACATLVVSQRAVDAGLPSTAALGGRPIGFASNPTRDDLAGRLSGMCELRGPLEAMRSEIDELRRREEAGARSLDLLNDQLRQAGALQRELLPSSLPDVKGLEVHSLYRPAEHLSGDLYDVFRLDDARTAFLLADATGHGLPAGMLSTLVRGSLRGRRRTDSGDARLEPHEVLAGANDELIGNALSDCQFVTAVYAVYDEVTHRLTWARAGAPYPILIPHGESPRLISSEGPVLGAFTGAYFGTVDLTLRPGDTVIFHSDGLEAVLLDRHTGLGCCDLQRTEWFASLGREPIAGALGNLDSRISAADETDWHVDDVTVLALHVRR